MGPLLEIRLRGLVKTIPDTVWSSARAAFAGEPASCKVRETVPTVPEAANYWVGQGARGVLRGQGDVPRCGSGCSHSRVKVG